MKRALVGLACVLVASIAQARAADPAIPAVLEPWQEWVLHDDAPLRCPARLGVRLDDGAATVCAWPGVLELDVAAAGARFRQRWQVYAEEWVPLAGSSDDWPVDVRVDGRPVAVLDRDGQPAVQLSPGDYEITGEIRWADRPASLAVPVAAVLIDLAIDGRPVITPDRTESAGRASVWLGPRPAATPQTESLDVRVHRRLEDGIPGRLETRILLSVAGPPREVTLGPVLPADFSVLGIASQLPARLDREHRLHLQLQRGNWQVTVHARAPGVVDAFELPVPAEPWPPRETLSFTPRDALRIVTIEGASPTDPGQAGVPPDWQGQSAYVLSPGEGLRLVERSRGLAGDAGTRLELQRELWLDFDHAGWLARDRLTGELSGRWRLGMTAPWQLESVTTDGRHLSVTRGDNGETGFELRSARVDVDALASLPMAASELPASGWQHVLDAAVTQLNLPPGHRLIAAFGVAESRGDWLGRWTLLDIFVVLLVTVAAFRMLGPVGAAVALPALALGYHEPLAPTWVWVNVVLAVALVRALPTGRLRQWASVWRAVSFVLLLLVLVPFAFVQLRLALYPQLSEPAFAAFAPIGAQAPRSERPVMEDEASKAYEAAMTSALEARDAAGLAQAAPDAAPAPSPPTAIEYLPGTVAQTGPARPQWRYQQYWLEFAAPVEPGQIVRLVIAPPWAVSTLRVLAVAFAVVFLLLLAQGVVAPPARRAAAATTGAAVAFVAFAVMIGLPMSSAQAQAAIPTTELLRELERRLLEPPSCAPECASLAAAYVDVGATEAEIALDVHAAAPTAFPLPRLGNPLAYSQATERGGSAVPVVADQGGQAWALVEPGIRRIELVVPIGDATQFQLRFPRVPKRVEARAPGWSVDGIAAGRLIGDTVSLQREALADGGERPAREGVSAPIAPFVIVERRLLLDLDWTVTTSVVRVAPFEGGFSVEVPLLDGEAVTDAGPGVEIADGVARVSMAAGQEASRWRATLTRDHVLELEAAEDRSRSDIWRVAAGPNFHLEFAGTPEVPSAAGNERRFVPRAGEALRIEVTRPEPIAGESLVVDLVRAEHRVAQQSTATELGYRYRSTQGGRQLLRLPEGSTLEEIRVDDRPVPLRAEQNVVALPVEPGEHAVVLRVTSPTSIAWQLETPVIDLGAPAGNITTEVELPASRWILWTGGSGVGPAVLYWSELIAFVVLALLIGRLPQSPLRSHEWLLLGLGLSTFSWWVLILFAGWLFAMRWRERTQLPDPMSFNLVQLILAGLTIVALMSLVSAIPNGLLGTPDMRIAGPGSQGNHLAWFDDRIGGELPVKTVLSVSIWWYKVAMLAWALWLSFALVRWVPWAWRAYSAGGYWQEGRRKVRTPPP